MLSSRMLRGAVVRQITPRLTYGSAAQPQVGLLFQCQSGIEKIIKFSKIKKSRYVMLQQMCGCYVGDFTLK